MLVGLGGVGFSQASVPLYAQDWGTQLFSRSDGSEQYPQTIELIHEFAGIYGEGTNLDGDSPYFANDPGLKKLFYLGMTNFWYGGPRPYINAAQDLFHFEENFYHTTDPSSLVAWRNATGQVELHWTWDERFATIKYLETPGHADRVTDYLVIRTPAGGGAETTISVTGANSLVDTGVDPNTEYSYRVISVFGGQQYIYTPQDVAPTVPVTPASGLHFWREHRNYQETALDKREDQSSFPWAIAFGVDGEPTPGSLALQIWTSYDPYDADSEAYTVLTDFSYQAGEVVFDYPDSVTLGYFQDNGGVISRLVYTNPATGQDDVYPADHDGRKHFYWSTVNNRVMACKWYNYKMRIEGPEQHWRSRFIAIAQELANGVTPEGQGGSVSFDGIFVDSVLNKFLYNNVRPYEYQGASSFSTAANNFLQTAANSIVGAKLYPNPDSMELMEGVEGYSGIGGAMFENWPTRLDNLNMGFLPALWLTQKHPEWQTFLE